MWRRLLFAMVFCLLIPGGLVLLARDLDRELALPGVQSAFVGWFVVIVGLAVMGAATIELWIRGEGLPMSPFPPKRLVRSGPYALIPHPIYAGATVLIIGIAVVTGSGAALWSIAPLVGLACIAMVLGYERSGLIERFGAVPVPALGLAPAAESPVTGPERLATHVAVFVPWTVAIAGAAALPAPDAISSRMPWESGLPVVDWAGLLWCAAPLLALIAPVVVRERTDLRRFQSAGIVGLMLWVLARLSLPLATEPAVSTGATGIAGGAMDFVRAWDPSGLASFASWRVFWACCSAGAIGLSRRGAGWALWPVVVGIAASGVLCGCASVADFVSGFGLFMIAWHAQRLWLAVLRRLERVANSWMQWDVGPVRVLVHAVYAGLAAGVALLVGSVLVPAEWHLWFIGAAAGGVIGAAAWGRAIEGGKLSRPFGYFGCVLGVLAVILIAGGTRSWDFAWRLAASMAVVACIAQPIGRLRCLVQGCCHGRPCEGVAGMHHDDARSRVAKFTEWKGRGLYPTAAYSMAANLVILPLLLRAYALGARASVVVGAYLVLGGLARFVEEHYRGEPQTTERWGLRTYQWFAAGFVVAGLAVLSLDAPVLEGVRAGPAWWGAGLVALVYAVAMGVEFPRSNARGSRLS